VSTINGLTKYNVHDALKEWVLLEAYKVARERSLSMPAGVIESFGTSAPEDPEVWKRWGAEVYFGIQHRTTPHVSVISYEGPEHALLQLLLALRAGKISTD
jgi:hypothetical protein